MSVLTVRCCGDVVARLRPVDGADALMVLAPYPEHVGAGRYFRHKWPCPTCGANVEATEAKALSAVKGILGHGVSDVDLSTLRRMVEIA